MPHQKASPTVANPGLVGCSAWQATRDPTATIPSATAATRPSRRGGGVPRLARQVHQSVLMYVRVMVSWSASAPPPFVRLAGHPLRWRLLGELARSDRRVRELVALLDQPQNLVSYHLGKLRD